MLCRFIKVCMVCTNRTYNTLMTNDDDYYNADPKQHLVEMLLLFALIQRLSAH